VRAKGILWLATRNEMAVNFSQAGPSIQIGPGGYWIAALSEEEQNIYKEEDPEWAAEWDPVWGDRITELVLIGVEMNQAEITEQLDACLLTEEEMQGDWQVFADPLPHWESEEISI
jgi:G3E family GTPase